MHGHIYNQQNKLISRPFGIAQHMDIFPSYNSSFSNIAVSQLMHDDDLMIYFDPVNEIDTNSGKSCPPLTFGMASSLGH